MAVSPDQIKYMANVLRTVGYPVDASHKPGEMDQAFLTAYNKALPAIWMMVTNGEEGPLKEPMDNDAFERQFKKRLTDTKLAPLQLYANGTSYLKPVIQKSEPNLTDAMLNPATVKDFVGMLKEPGQMFAGLRAVEAERVLNKPSVASENTQGQVIKASLQEPAQPAAAVQPVAHTVPQTGPAAASSTDLEKAVRRVQVYGLAIPEDGQLTDALKQKIQDKLSTVTEWNKAEQGEYTKELHDVFVARDPAFGRSSFGAAMTGFFKAGGDINVAPTAPAASANQNTGGTPNDTKGAGATVDSQEVAIAKKEVSEIEYATSIAKAFLFQVAEGVNKKRAEVKEKAGLFGSVLIAGEDLPPPSSSEDFDEVSRTSLQAVLKTFQKQLKLTDEEIYNYTPAVGEKIEANFGDVAKNMTPEQKQALDEIKGKDEKKKGIGAIIESLNILKANNNIQDGKLYEGGPSIQLSGMGASILNWVFRLIGGIFPGAVPMMHDMVRQFTGGMDYNDLVPAEHRNAGVSAAAGKYADLPPEQRLKMTYLDAYDDAKKQNPGDTPEEIQQKLEKAMQRGLKGLNVLPFGDDKSRADYQKAFKTAMEKAAGFEHPEMAAGAFAETFLKLWKSERHANHDGNLNIGRHGYEHIDPDKYEFKIGRENGKPDFNMNDLKETYDELSKRQADSNTAQRPLVFFTGNNGVTMVAGMTAENMFTVQPVTQEMAAELDRALQNPDQKAARVELAKAAQTNPALSALSVMAGGYGEGYSLAQMRRDIDAPLPFETVRKNIYGGNPPPSDQERMQKRLQEPQPGSEAGGYGTTQERGPRSEEEVPRLSREGAIQRYQANKAEGIRTFNAVKTPQVVDNSNGRVYLQVLENPAGLYALRDQNFNGNLGRAVGAGSHFFAHRDVTSDMQRFTQEFQKFQSADSAYMKNWSQRDQMARFKSEYVVRGGNFEKDFPDLAAVANMQAYRRSGMTTADLGEHLAKKVKLDVSAYDRNEGVTIGGWLSNLFGGKSKQPASETGGVQYVERAQPKAQETPEAECNGLFRASCESRKNEFRQNGHEMTEAGMDGLPPGGGGPSATHRNMMRPAA